MDPLMVHIDSHRSSLSASLMILNLALVISQLEHAMNPLIVHVYSYHSPSLRNDSTSKFNCTFFFSYSFLTSLNFFLFFFFFFFFTWFMKRNKKKE
jgi:hypothetical protein